MAISKDVLPYLTLCFDLLLTKCFVEYVLKRAVLKTLQENAPERVYWRKLQDVETRFFLKEAFIQIWFLGNLQNIQRNKQYKSWLLNVITEINNKFWWFLFGYRKLFFFPQWEVVVVIILDTVHWGINPPLSKIPIKIPPTTKCFIFYRIPSFSSN